MSVRGPIHTNNSSNKAGVKNLLEVKVALRPRGADPGPLAIYENREKRTPVIYSKENFGRGSDVFIARTRDTHKIVWVPLRMLWYLGTCTSKWSLKSMGKWFVSIQNCCGSVFLPTVRLLFSCSSMLLFLSLPSLLRCFHKATNLYGSLALASG